MGCERNSMCPVCDDRFDLHRHRHHMILSKSDMFGVSSGTGAHVTYFTGKSHLSPEVVLFSHGKTYENYVHHIAMYLIGKYLITITSMAM